MIAGRGSEDSLQIEKQAEEQAEKIERAEQLSQVIVDYGRREPVEYIGSRQERADGDQKTGDTVGLIDGDIPLGSNRA